MISLQSLQVFLCFWLPVSELAEGEETGDGGGGGKVLEAPPEEVEEEGEDPSPGGEEEGRGLGGEKVLIDWGEEVEGGERQREKGLGREEEKAREFRKEIQSRLTQLPTKGFFREK